MKSLIKENILNIIVSLIIVSFILVFYTANVILSEAKDLKTRGLSLLDSSVVRPQNDTEIEGRIVNITHDNFDIKTKTIKSSSTKTYLQTKDKKLIELKPATSITAPNINSIKPNTVVKVKGIKTKDRIIYYKITSVKQNKSIKLKNYKKNNKLNYLQQDETPDTMGEQKTLVVLFNYADDQDKPVTFDEIKNNMVYDIHSVDNFVKENSYNKAWLNPTFFDWRALPSSAADYGNIIKLFHAAIKDLDSEVYFPDYKRLIFVFLNNGKALEAAGSTGTMYLESNDGDFTIDMSWIEAKSAFPELLAHELGHQFGFGHASSYNAGGTGVPNDLADFTSNGYNYVSGYSVYGDWDDNMGGGVTVDFNHWSTVWKNKAGWLEPSQVKVLTQSAEYELDQVELPSDGIKMLKIPIGYDVEGNEAAYYIEYRKPLGSFDKNYNLNDSEPDDAVQVRYKGEHLAYENLDLTPRWQGHTVRFGGSDANLDQPFFDPYRGIKIELLEKTGEDAASKARVKVTFSGVDLNSNNYLMRYQESEYDKNPQILTVSNNTTTSLDIGQLSIKGRDSSSFEILDDNVSNKTINAGNSQTISIHFTPTSSSDKFAYLNIPTNNEIRPNASVSLYGIDNEPPGPGWPNEPVNLYAPVFSTNTSNTNAFNISWLVTDSFSTIDGYELQYHPHTTTAWQTYKIDGSDWTPKESVTFTGKPGYNYYFKVRAKDKSGNTGYWTNQYYTIVPYDNTSLKYSSYWKNSTYTYSYKKTLKYSYTKGSYATFTFKGITLWLIAPKGPSRGIIDVYIRNKVSGVWSSYKKIKSVDLYSRPARSRVPIEIGWMSNKIYQVKFVASGRKNIKSTGTRIDIDGIAKNSDPLL